MDRGITATVRQIETVNTLLTPTPMSPVHTMYSTAIMSVVAL